ncbi:hypothetical protein [Nostoc sp. TCL240-02]|uniref:hypothetical protein n=1 Tax=Nostoc sp. TCL240-02 TaxID=2572090 RepID=UPI00157F8CB2|nr:hypothetical protein [Nostoc sp. TCL240-02]QKQ74221.1 hypothetical protein FBB35_13600 [Nostoc sp. TCL240-02]
MQIIQSPLGNNIHPLGVISSLSNSQGIILRKESHSLHSRNNLISTIQTKPPLVKSSKFFLSRQYEPSIEPLIGWDSWDNEEINSEFSLLEFDSSDSIAALENSNESVKDRIPGIMPTRIAKNTSKNNETSQNLNIKGKSKSKKTNKSQQPPETKSKSRTKKAIKSSTVKNVEQFVDESNVTINGSRNKLLTSDESLSIEENSETPIFGRNIASDNTENTTNDHSSTSGITVFTSPVIEDKSTLFSNFATDDPQVNSELLSSLPSADLSITESTLASKENIKSNNNTSELVQDLSIEFLPSNNMEETFTPSSNFKSHEQKLIPEVSESVNISEIPVSPNPPHKDIETHQLPSVVDNKSSADPTDLIQVKEVSPTLNFPSQEEEILNTNTNSEAITAIKPDLILESTANDFIKDNAAVDNTLTLSSTLNSSDIDEAPTLLHPLENHENTIGAYIPSSNSESSVVKNQTTVQQEIYSNFSQDVKNVEKPTQNLNPNSTSLQSKGENSKPLSLQDKGFTDTVKSQEIDSSVTSDFPDSATIQLTPTSADIEDIPSLFSNSDSDEQLVTLESQSLMAANVLDVSANVSSLRRDGNFENTASEFTESQSILAAPEITETPIIIATSPEISEALVASTTSPEISEALVASTTSPEIAEAPIITATSPEISEALVASTTSHEIDEAPIITATSPEISEALVASTTSHEIDEAPIITATSPEISEALVASTISPEIDEAPIITATSPEISEALVASTTSHEIAEAPIITATSPEISEALVASTTSPKIDEAPIITATSPEISEALVASTTSHEIAEAPIITATSPEIAEEASIFRKIIDNEQTVESENPEISTLADTWDNPDILDNPISLQDEVSTAPKVEQNAIAQKPAPKGYATGGHVTDSRVENRQQIAPSDTVPAMLTPGEFVINTRDAQKNLPLLHHINTGGTPHDIILPSLQTPNPTEAGETISPETPTKVDSFPDISLQLKSAETDSPEISNSLIPSSLGLNISQNKLSVLNSPQLNPLQNEIIDVGESSPQYSSPPMIFRKANPSTHTPSQWSNTPSQWSSVEDLLNGNNDDFTSFNFNDGESNSQNYEFSHGSESPQVFAKHLPTPRGFANGGEVTPPDISREIQPITETIESASSSSQGDEKDDTADIEALAREIYHRLRQRIEIERERHGGYSGRLPW